MKDFDVRQYSIRLRKDGLKAPATIRSKRAIVTVKKFIEKNTRAKTGDVLIGEELNNIIWNKGIRNPPTKVDIFVQRLKNGKVFVNLQGKALRIEKEEKKDKSAKKDEKSLEEITQESAPKVEDKKEEKAESIKKPKKTVKE